MPVSLTRVATFHARHRYWIPAWSDEENRARFGWTSDAPGHGHAYQAAITVAGIPDPVTGMILDLPVLDAAIAAEIGALDGRHLNEDVPAFAYGATLPTCEALATYLYQRIRERLPDGVVLERVRIAEDTTLHADCTGLP